jgi:hypothetical protein
VVLGIPCPVPGAVTGTTIYTQEVDTDGNPTGNCLPLIAIPGTIAALQGPWFVQGSYQQIPPLIPPGDSKWVIGRVFQVFAVTQSQLNDMGHGNGNGQ